MLQPPGTRHGKLQGPRTMFTSRSHVWRDRIRNARVSFLPFIPRYLIQRMYLPLNRPSILGYSNTQLLS